MLPSVGFEKWFRRTQQWRCLRGWT